MDAYFTDKKIEDLVTDHNWELVPAAVANTSFAKMTSAI